MNEKKLRHLGIPRAKCKDQIHKDMQKWDWKKRMLGTEKGANMLLVTLCTSSGTNGHGQHGQIGVIYYSSTFLLSTRQPPTKQISFTFQ